MMLAITEASIVTIVVAGIAATGSIVSAVRAARIDSKVDTGREQDIGSTIHGLDQTTEVILAQLHTNTQETLDVAVRVLAIDEKLDQHMTKLDQHITEVAPLANWVRQQMGEEE